MKIEMWSDIACPFCYIGKKNLETALERFAHGAQVEVTLRSFELDPQAPKSPGLGLNEILARKYEVSIAEAAQMGKNVSERAAQIGLTFNLDATILTNLLDAHRLLQFAKQHGRQSQLADRLFAAYFTQGLDLGAHDVLARLAVDTGLDALEVDRMLESDAYGDEVRKEEQAALELGLSGVPAFVLAGRYLISGAQPAEAMLEALEKAWKATAAS